LRKLKQCGVISQGNNFTSVNLNRNYLKEICILLHNKISVDEIKKHLNWTDNEIDNALQTLLKEELIKKTDQNSYVSTCMVISEEEGKIMFEESEKIAEEVVRLIEDKFKEIKSKTYSIGCFNSFTFESISLFILSNVLLDTVQIHYIEELFLKSDRPNRNGMNYYFSIKENNENSKKEAFGIYGNMYRKYGEVAYGLYGNERLGINFHTIQSGLLKEYFSSSNITKPEEFKKYTLQEVINYHIDENYDFDKNLKEGLNRLGIMNNDKICIPILNEMQFMMLSDVAEVIKDDYIKIFENNRKDLINYYKNTSYFNEVTFEEYFIWWYHIFYTKVTDILIDRGRIKKPKTGNFGYIVM